MPLVMPTVSYDRMMKMLKEKNISLARLRREAGLIKTDIEAIEHGICMEMDSLNKVADYLGCYAFELIDFI